MRMRSAFSFIVATLVLCTAPGSAADGRLRIEVSPRISQAPAEVRIRAIVSPSAQNRGHLKKSRDKIQIIAAMTWCRCPFNSAH